MHCIFNITTIQQQNKDKAITKIMTTKIKKKTILKKYNMRGILSEAAAVKIATIICTGLDTT